MEWPEDAWPAREDTYRKCFNVAGYSPTVRRCGPSCEVPEGSTEPGISTIISGDTEQLVLEQDGETLVVDIPRGDEPVPYLRRSPLHYREE